MLKNYYYLDENSEVNVFFKKNKDKKLSHYIILDTIPKSFVDIRTIALKTSNFREKLKNLKKNISDSNSSDLKENLDFLIRTGDRIIDTEDGFFDFIEALKLIKKENNKFLNDKVESVGKKEIYALNKEDKINSAKNLFLQKKINILPVIRGLKVIGELRPVDLLVSNFFEKNDSKSSVYNKVSKTSILDLPVFNLMNDKPLVMKNTDKIKNIIDLMINKNVPSVIIVDKNENLYTIISYKDVFKLYTNKEKKNDYSVELIGSEILYPDEYNLIYNFAEKFMKKIIKISNYDNLKINFKKIGKTDLSHKRKVEIKLLLSKGNNVLQVKKEISKGINDEEFNDRQKNVWNIPQMVQSALDSLMIQVKQKKRNN